jgi:hypothetical protein
MKTYLWTGGMAPFTLDSGIWWWWVISLIPTGCFTLRPGDTARYPLNRRLGGTQSKSGCFERKDSLFPDRTWTMILWMGNPQHTHCTNCTVPALATLYGYASFKQHLTGWIRIIYFCCCWGHTVVQLVEALHYKLEGRGFDYQWCHWNVSLT